VLSTVAIDNAMSGVHSQYQLIQVLHSPRHI